MLLLLGASCSKIDSETNARLDKVALSAIPPGQHKQVCGDVTADAARCYARVRTNSAGDVQALTTPSGLGPVALQSAYLAPTGGAGQTVAIVDAYDDPYAESELATYRSQFGLPPCTTANGCFKKVNQNGAQSPLPVADSGWAVEIALDLAMVSAICPSCNILLVEANSNSWSDLGTAVNSAAALAPAAISNSWGGSESSSSTTYDSQYFNHPGILITVSSGDYGYGVEYPASSKYVLRVGGTSLVTSTSSRGWAETVWNGAGSGCSAYIDKPSLQTDPGCSKRTVADVSAVADPNTGVAVYSTYEGGWLIVGGTSASSPIVAAIFAAAGKTAVGTIFPYTHTGAFYDVTTGGNGSCSPAYLCTGQVGFDGPTGWGTPNGQLIAASSDVAQVFSVTFNPSTLEGGSPSTGTILLTAFAPAGGAMVALTNSAPGLVTVPSSVVVPAGSQNVTFPITTVQTSTQTTASIQATYPTSISVTGTLTLLASPTPASLVLSPTSVPGGTTSSGTVTLSGPAPTGGADVSLSSSNVAVATVPATMNIPQGATSGTFTITTLGQISSTSATISAAYHGLTQSAVLAVTTTPGVSSIIVSPSLLEGGGNVTGYVYLNTAAPTGGAVVLLASNSGAATVPASVTVSAGQSSATFAIATSSVTAQTAVTISGTYPAALTVTTTLTVLPSPTPLSVTLAPTSVTGGTPVTATVLLSGPAPAGGADVTLTSSYVSVATVPATINIPAGATSGTFTVTTLPQTYSTYVTISAAYHGLTRSATLTVTLAAALSSISVTPSILEGGGSATGYVYLNTTAPTGGAVVLLASNSGAANVPASITVTAGLSSASFSIATTAVTSQTAVTISGTYPSTTTMTTTLTVVPSPTPSSVTLAPSTVTGGNPSTGTVLLSGPAPAGGSVVALASSLTSSATVPASVSIPAGVTSGTFTVTTLAQTATRTVTISASLNGLSASAVLTVTRVLPVGNATFDTTLKVPRCLTVGTFCDTGGMIDGRGLLGPETNTPNTINATCIDGTAGTYHYDESLDRLKISTTDGSLLAAGKTVLIEATVWSYSTSDSIDLYFAPDATNPVWTLLVTQPTTVSQQLQVLSTTFVLPSATLPAIRGNFRYVGSPGSCTTGSYDDRDDLVFALSTSPPVNQPPVVSAGSNQTITLPAAANLSGTVADDGLPNPPGAVTVTWSKDSGPGTVTFANPAVAVTTATFSVAGTYVLRFTGNDSALSASATVTITVNPAAPVNQPPVVSAGSNQTITLPAAANLSGTVTDDGLPNPPATVTVTWSKDSGPGTVTFANPAAKVTTATFSAAGTYVLRLTASDSALSASATVTITVNSAPVNQAPVVNAGSNQTITLPAAANLNGTVTDDGLPNPPATVTVTWSKDSGPGTVTFANPAAKVTTATFSAAGTYVLRLTASDSALSASATVTITVNSAPVNQAPVVNAGSNQTITLPAAANLNGTVTDDGLPSPPATVTVTWSKSSGPGTVTFANPAAKVTTATFSAAGSYVLKLTASDSVLTASATTTVTVNAAGTGACAGLCTSPTIFTINGSYQSGNLGTGAVCYQTTSVVHGGNCSNFVSPRTLKVNGTTETCNSGNWSSIPAARNGGYCIQTTSGNQSYASFALW
jgi:adenosine/AMP kinase